MCGYFMKKLLFVSRGFCLDWVFFVDLVGFLLHRLFYLAYCVLVDFFGVITEVDC